MDNEIALVDRENEWVFCDTRMVSKKFNIHHSHVKRTVELIRDRLTNVNTNEIQNIANIPNIKLREYLYRGRQFSYYELNKSAFILTAMRFDTNEAFVWQIKFIEAFDMMERQILLEHDRKQDALWKTQREQGKLVRLTAMDTVKDFVDYATSQGSENAKFYYKHITVACYKCLQLIQHKKPSLRDTLDTLELSQLMLAEIVAERSIRKHMLENEHYKAIFVLVKQDLENFAKSLMIESKEIVKSRNK